MVRDALLYRRYRPAAAGRAAHWPGRGEVSPAGVMARKDGGGSPMRTARAGGRIALVPDPLHTTVVTLELEGATEPVSGTVCLTDGTRRRFAGLLELIRLLDDARGAVARGWREG